MSKGKVKNADSVAEEEKVQTQSENDENAEELSDLEVLQKKNIELESKVKEYENLIKRQQAEFENSHGIWVNWACLPGHSAKEYHYKTAFLFWLYIASLAS